MSGGEGGIAPTNPEIGTLLESTDAFSARNRVGRPPRVMAAELVELRHACDLLELEFSETAANFAATNEYEIQGSITPIDWIRHNCRMSGHTAAERVCVGDQIDSLPQSTDAMCEGKIGFAHLALLARTARALAESETATSFDESALLSRAQETSVGRFRHVCHHARHADDPEQYAADEVRGVEARVTGAQAI